MAALKVREVPLILRHLSVWAPPMFWGESSPVFSSAKRLRQFSQAVTMYRMAGTSGAAGAYRRRTTYTKGKALPASQGILPAGYHLFAIGLYGPALLKTMEGLRYCSPGEWGKLLGGWTVSRKPRRSETKSVFCLTKANRVSGQGNFAKYGWRQSRIQQVYSISMATSVSTTASRQSCRLTAESTNSPSVDEV